MTRRHTLTQMERLLDRLQADRTPYAFDAIQRLSELRSGLAVLEGRAMKEPPSGDWQKRMAKRAEHQAERAKN
jgi:hypothetical protein